MGATVIQGSFPHGITHLAHHRAAAAHVAQPASRVPQPASRVPQAAARPANGAAVELPAHLANVPAHGGQPLPPDVRQRMESFFRASFADVRVHVGHAATTLGAHAFTHGSNIHFAHGRYQPATAEGQRVLAHELAHVVQQRSGRVRNPFGSGVAVVHDHALEAEAERLGRTAVMQPMLRTPTRVVQRMNNDFDLSSIDDVRPTGLANVKFKVIHKHIRPHPTVKGDTSLDGSDFNMKRNRQVVSVQYRGPHGGRTHHEILCEIRGIYGKRKYVKFDFTSTGYRAIYNADPGMEGLKTLKTLAPLSTANTTDKLYDIFMQVARRGGHYRGEGVNTCETFATRFFEAVTGQTLSGHAVGSSAADAEDFM